MLIDYLIKLRQQPKAVRNRHALMYAAGFTLVVALVWFTSGAAVRSSPNLSPRSSQSAGIFSSFINDAKEQWDSAKRAWPTPDETALNPAVATGSSAIILSPADIMAAQERLQRVTPTSTESVTLPEEVMIVPASERWPDNPPPN